MSTLTEQIANLEWIKQEHCTELSADRYAALADAIRSLKLLKALTSAMSEANVIGGNQPGLDL